MIYKIYYFDPVRDITAYELATIWTFKYSGNLEEKARIIESMPEELRRHFKARE